jgi:hypothetical protein
MASFGAVRHDREPLSNPYQTHDLCLVDLCPQSREQAESAMITVWKHLAAIFEPEATF